LQAKKFAGTRKDKETGHCSSGDAQRGILTTTSRPESESQLSTRLRSLDQYWDALLGDT
jgi:hypothetical protein